MKQSVVKKGLFTLAACSIALLATAACGNDTPQQPTTSVNSVVPQSPGENPNPSTPEPKSAANAEEALSLLKSGNNQFTQGSVNLNVTEALRKNLAENGQKPHTVVITCSDSRVPPELIFNSSLGEVFVIRTAGNVVGDYEIGSVEYAVDHLESPLVLVMGHTQCGAVDAAIDGHADGHIEDILEEITPSVTKAKQQATGSDQIADLAQDFNVENTIDRLMGSDIISRLVRDGKVTVQGCKYDIENGTIRYFDTQQSNQENQNSSNSSNSSNPSSQL